MHRVVVSAISFFFLVNSISMLCSALRPIGHNGSFTSQSSRSFVPGRYNNNNNCNSIIRNSNTSRRSSSRLGLFRFNNHHNHHHHQYSTRTWNKPYSSSLVWQQRRLQQQRQYVWMQRRSTTASGLLLFFWMMDTIITRTQCMSSSSSTTIDETEQPQEEEEQQLVDPLLPVAPVMPLLPDELLEHDHYNGITIHLDRLDTIITNDNIETEQQNDWAQRLRQSLQVWREQGRKGIWMQVPHNQAWIIPLALQEGFQFHMVSTTTTTTNDVPHQNVLVLSQWLPTTMTSKLPAGPSHQVGVGCLLFHPYSNGRKLLVVQEQTGPAAAFSLWKLPTGLVDAKEDIHQAAVRELYEETGIHPEQVQVQGILTFRQAHRKGSSSDLFFICQLQLLVETNPHGTDANDEDDANEWVMEFRPCPDEIAAIQWMSVEEYCAQDPWQKSPIHQEMNRAILQASQRQSSSSPALFQAHTLPFGFGSSSTSTLYYNSRL